MERIFKLYFIKDINFLKWDFNFDFQRVYDRKYDWDIRILKRSFFIIYSFVNRVGVISRFELKFRMGLWNFVGIEFIC